MIKHFSNPNRFMRLSHIIKPIAGIVALISFAVGLYYAFWNSPPDYQQGDTVRIMYVHVPAAWMALFIYTTMAVASVAGIVWKHILADLYTRAVAPIGALFTAICLVTGSLWGKPMWGTWWVWDARLTSVLILFFLYLGYMALVDAFEDEDKGNTAGGFLVIIGVVNIPIIKFSVDWWQTLHQPASIMRLESPAIDTSMLYPLFMMAIAFHALFIVLALLRTETEIFKRKARIAQREKGYRA